MTLAVPSFNEGHVASVDDEDTVIAHGAEQGPVGWNPIDALASVPLVRYGA